MKCTVCGKELNEGTRFCSGCGILIDLNAVGNKAAISQNTVSFEKATGKRKLKIGLVAVVAIVGIIGYGIKENIKNSENSNATASANTNQESVVDSGNEEHNEHIDGENGEYDITEGGIHRYEYVINDCNWNDARWKATEAGGYLVRINSREEYEYIISEIEQQGYSNIVFRIGARRNTEQTDYYWVDEDNKRYGYSLNNSDYWSVSEWKQGEPNFMDGDIEETCVEIYYNSDEDRWVWNDIPNDLVSIAPYYSGRAGYIIEYEE